MDGSLGLQGTKTIFWASQTLVLVWGKASFQGKSKMWELQRPHFKSQQHFLHKQSKPAEKSCSAWNWDWNREWWTSASAAPWTPCPNKVSVKGCDFPCGTGTSSPLTLCLIPLLLFSTLLAKLLSWYHVMHLEKQTSESGKSYVSICRLLASGYL